MKQSRLFAASLVLLATTSNLSAQEQAEGIKDYAFDDVVVTATGTQRRLVDSPAPIAVITGEEINRSGVTKLDDALVLLSPSFSSHTSGMGTTMTLNGLDDDYFIFLVDGRRVERDYPFHQINMSRVKRIEVLSGASAVLYGANAIGGVVNIITDHSDATVDVSSTTQLGSEGRLSEFVNVDLNVGKLSSTTNYTLQKSDGWQLSEYKEVNDELVPAVSVASVGYRRESASQRFGYALNDKLSVSVNGGFYIYNTDRPTEEGEGDYSYDLYHEDYTYGADATYKLSDVSSLVATFYGEEYTYRRDYSEFDDEKEYVFQDRTTYQNLNLRGVFGLFEGNTLSAGAEYIIDGLLDDDYDDKTRTYALFAQDEFTLLDNFTGVVGARYTYQNKFGSNLSPNAALMYKLNAMHFRATYSSGFRAPTLAQLYAEDKFTSKLNSLSYSNENLNPERSQYTSLSAEYNSKILSMSVTGFYNHITDMIAYSKIDGLVTYEDETDVEQQQLSNVGQSEIWGLNIAVNARFGAGFTAGAAYTGLDPKNITDDEPIDKSVRNAITANAAWSREWGLYNFGVSLNARYSDERYYAIDGESAPDYWMWDLNTTHSFEFKNFFLEPAVGVENLFDYVDDRPYCSNYATLSPGRSIFASVTVRFKY